MRREARADLRLAEKVEDHEVLAASMAAGRVNLAQGRAIVASLERLPRTGPFAVSLEQRASAEAHLLTKMILAISSPSRPAGVAEAGTECGIDPDLPTPVRHGIALTQLLEAISAKAVPRAGGFGATIVVRMTLDQLMAKLDTAGVCVLDTGGRISAAEARRLACTGASSRWS